MFYATAGQQTTPLPQPASRNASAPTPQQSGFPSETLMSPDLNDFPALGSQPTQSSSSSYMTQTQPSQPNTSTQHPHLQQQMFLPQQANLVPPPGISGPIGQTQMNGAIGQASRGEDFPALGGATGALGPVGSGGEVKDRVCFRPMNVTPSSPSHSMVNGGNGHAESIAPSNPPPRAANLPVSASEPLWPRKPSRPQEPIVRPVQQVFQSPVDNWDLKSMLMNIRAYSGHGDKGDLMFGVDLGDLGINVESTEPLYPNFVTPWTDPRDRTEPFRVEESWHTPACYHVTAKPIETKLGEVADETLFYIFYSQPQDVVQLQVAFELYHNRGWRYHMELRLWFTSEQLAAVDLRSLDKSHSNPIQGPFTLHDPNTLRTTSTDESWVIDANLLEITRPAAVAIEESLKREAARSPNGSVTSGSGSLMSSVMGAGYGQMQVTR
ncbi:hypothetical protein TREMEDRAFT_36926 [Tremella mesenterica DSM 1558]|uniref:uncharacterized protein n=1 Tax=Tremella mesenterica (strain ATCC 24925 / CBS 8224 / DSM 1558 / NBRC 9311 / NRRL Y-6157 / RJB 2259-6 / UBC 559-6) TaxID=578456 RepID=UPI0003F48FA7|nr:uncharacterized protein TREMEDRAFT_36926 [Tremella mesenterica DSM 1558]EIW72770.1 hypothetical protein TREMEDRAFT_36926 [Tremella mesenterica DSM 1558]